MSGWLGGCSGVGCPEGSGSTLLGVEDRNALEPRDRLAGLLAGGAVAFLDSRRSTAAAATANPTCARSAPDSSSPGARSAASLAAATSRASRSRSVGAARPARPRSARNAAGSDRARPSSHRYSYAKLRTAVRLTAWLRDQDLALEQLRQPRLDEWIADAPSRALPTRDFLDWAHHTGLIPALQIRRPPPQASSTAIDHATRLRHARALLDDDALELAARVTGCLVLLYGQHVTRIVTLRTDDLDLHGPQVRLRLGHDPIEVPDPLAALLRALHAQTAGPWLLPGAKPGTHIGAERIRRRLRQLGIRPDTGRTAALLALAASVPAPILGELLGYCDDTANHWRRAAAGDWARYASLATTPSS